MNKAEKEKIVLTNYERILQVKKNEIIQKINTLENYKNELVEILAVILKSFSFSSSKNALLGYGQKPVKDPRVLEILLFSPYGSNVRIQEILSTLEENKNTTVVAIYEQSATKGIPGKLFSPQVHEYAVPNFNSENINLMITTIINIANHFMNVSKSVSQVFVTSNLTGFDTRRTQVAPIIDDKLVIDRIKKASSVQKKIEVFIPTYSRWVQETFEGYLWAKMRYIFVDLEIAVQLQETLKVNNSMDILQDKLDELDYETLSKKIKDSGDELSIIQGADSDN